MVEVAELSGLVDGIFDEVIDLRRWLHQHPELSHQEVQTTAAIREQMLGLGLTERPAGTPTGAVFTLEGGRPGRTVLVRADIDGLPVQEQSGLSYSSENDAMHACGHDGHAAMAFGVASVLADRAEDLPGNYVFLFQPAEEGGGGASKMIEGGVLDGLGAERMIGCHLGSGSVPTGLIILREGIAMSAAHQLRFELAGSGGHGALASTSGNVVLAAAALVTRLSSVVTGITYEGVECVCSAGMVQVGTAPNVVPQTASIAGTLRTFTETNQADAITELRRLVAEIEREYEIEIALDIGDYYPPVTNDALATGFVEAAAAATVGDDMVLRAPPLTPSDDVSEFLRRIPGCYFFVGATPETGSGMHHSPTFVIDEEALRVGARVLALGALRLAES